MVFSEPTFLFLFLPACLMAYLAVRGIWRNHLLLAASLVFYAWGDPKHLLVLLSSIALNYAFGLAIESEAVRGGRTRGLLAFGIAANLVILAVFKYLGFILDNLGVSNAYDIAPGLPIGISFFTFQALSYLVDLQARRIEVQRSPLRLALYISMFPQLIAGPIVRYSEVEAELTERHTSQGDIAAGMQRFVTGLAKKALIADPMGLTADTIFSIPAGGLGPETAWLGVLAYTLQIYFDFSAYSDMAIGLGRIFGFRFPENFNYPYAACSITDFWRRWHMTLSRWFRDYLYIPLGGNREGPIRTYVNLGIVFLATGIWHGAAWTFIFWGVWHGAFLVLERSFLGSWLAKTPDVVTRLYLLSAVIMGWVPFRADGFSQAIEFWSAMLLGTTGPNAALYPLARYFDGYVL
ncbi:MBOAT family O-acyltransferase, partial [Loktanella sp. DJP18]|uniref:MBOAT family O-acyltransferase n=1 Tax=Loktanella sp. DJP18 TaxID=3409788 RepID=UPI003BB7D9F4